MILVGDVGGTKTNLALYDLEDGTLRLIEKQQYASREYTTFLDVIVTFKEQTTFSSIDSVCFGVAGPIIEGRCRTTNLPWDIATVDLQSFFGISNVYLLNDLEATAYGMLYLHEDEFVTINSIGRAVKGNRAVIAAGTGLGEAILFWDGQRYHPIGSEGGHTDFAPATALQDELLQWMRYRYGGHVSYERILSGPGIYMLYEFLLEKSHQSQSACRDKIEGASDKSAMVSECALVDHDPLCLEALRLFVEIYGAEAGNLALKSMSLGGVYIGGGIAPKLLSVMSGDNFLSAFMNKGRFEEMLRAIEIKISLNPDTALQGAANFAVDKEKKIG